MATQTSPLRELLIGVLLLAVFALTACGGAQQAQVAASPARPRAPDIHGEPLALLPPSPLVWLRVEMNGVRLSQHWESAFPLLQTNAGESLATMERELGFDPLRAADTIALGLYAPPGARPGDGTHAWPVLYARGQIQRDAIIAAARARARPEDPLVERTMEGVAYYATRDRGYLFPANDVVMVFDASLTRRVVRQLQGLEQESPAHETRFDSLWSQADGRGGAIQFAGDIAALRAIGAPVDEVATAAGQGNAGASRIEQAVIRADVDAAVSVRIAALASDPDAAHRVIADIDAVRTALMRRWDVRLLGMSRLLMQGLTDVSEGRMVRIRVDAQPSEVVRLLRVARIAAQ